MIIMAYKPTTARYRGKTRTYYIIYKETHIHDYKGKKKRRTQTRVKRVYIPGKLKKWARGTFVTRFGTRVHGIKFVYINPIKGGAGRGHRIKQMRIEKIVPIPKNARSVKVRTKAPRKPRMDIT